MSDLAEEAFARLGGNSLIGKLAERVEQLEANEAENARQLSDLKSKLQKAHRISRVCVGAKLYPPTEYSQWHSGGSFPNGNHEPTGEYVIVALGEDWVVIQGCGTDNRGDVFFRHGYDIREELSDGILGVDLE